MRFTKQRAKYDCSSVSIINACKFFGQKISYTKHKNDLADLLDLTPQGCRTTHFISLMRKIHQLQFFNIKTKSVHRNSKSVIVNEKQIPMVLIHGHVFIVVKETKKSYKCINLYSNQTISYVLKKKFTKMLKSGNIVVNLKEYHG